VFRKDAPMKTQMKSDYGLPSLALVFGYIAVKELQNIKDRIGVLSRLGYGNKEIATICGTTEGHVAKEKSISKKTKKY
jgi:hypothetical protein